jgi:hypothetical protein
VPLSGLIISSCLISFAFIWAYTARLTSSSPLRRTVHALVSIPVQIWLLLGVAAFALPVLEYWYSARSHPNALAGFLPWADATEYFHCSETFLQRIPSADHCGKRSYYIAFFTDLLWLTGNRLQPALLLQALALGSAALLFCRSLTRNLSSPSILAAYAVLYVFASALCSGLIMSENIGFLLGVLAMALLWRCADTPRPLAFLFGIALLASALSVRPGAMFVLPALLGWYFFYCEETIQKRLITIALGIAVAMIAIGFTSAPTLIAGGTLGSTHSNLSYSLYGLVAGGKGWLHVTFEHPEIFNRGDSGRVVTDRIYEAAIESILIRPHLFVLGYIKGIAHYIYDLFRFTTDFKPLRFALLLLWIPGIWMALKQWRQPRSALLLFLQTGLIVSAPFIAIDGQNRVFAGTVAVDALFVALGLMWVSKRFISRTREEPRTSELHGPRIEMLAGAGMMALILPVAMLAAIRPNSSFTAHSAPKCAPSLEAVVVHLNRSTLVLSLVEAGQDTLFPLRVRADHFGSRFHKWVYSKEELRLPAGHALIWATRLEEGFVGKRIYFSWPGELPSSGTIVGFCVQRPLTPGKRIGTATAIHIK